MGFEEATVERDSDGYRFVVRVELGELRPTDVPIERYADAAEGGEPVCIEMVPDEQDRASAKPQRYTAHVGSKGPADDYTSRVILPGRGRIAAS